MRRLRLGAADARIFSQFPSVETNTTSLLFNAMQLILLINLSHRNVFRRILRQENSCTCGRNIKRSNLLH